MVWRWVGEGRKFGREGKSMKSKVWNGGMFCLIQVGVIEQPFCAVMMRERWSVDGSICGCCSIRGLSKARSTKWIWWRRLDSMKGCSSLKA